MMQSFEPLKYYLETIHTLQNYLVGFALLQTLAFLYGLKTFGTSIYPLKKQIVLGIAVANIFNMVVLFVATRYEVKITNLLISGNYNLHQELESIMWHANWYRSLIITAINGLAAAVFYMVARKMTTVKISVINQ